MCIRDRSSIVPVFVIVSLEILLSALCMASRRAEKLLSGSPRVVIQHGRLDQAQLADLRFTADDLLEALRGKDVFEPVSYTHLDVYKRQA